MLKWIAWVSLWSYIHSKWVPEPDLTTNLTPFWDSQSTYWKSSGLQSAKDSLNYTYPELLGNPTPAQVARIVSTLYGPGPKMFSTIQDQNPVEAQNSILEWSVRVRCKEFELGGSFSVPFFLIQVPDDSREWFTSPYFVGSFDVFANSNPEECTNCQSHADDEIEGYVHLNAGIAKHSGQETFDPADVEPFLRNNLHWRVVDHNGSGTAARLPSLEVVVSSATLTLSPGASFPTVGEPHYYNGITFGRPGGSHEA